MREIVWLNSAVNDVVRLRDFIAANNSEAAQKAAQILKKSALLLAAAPDIGKPVTDLIGYRDLAIKFGAAGYVMRYKIYENDIYIVHLRHYRELKFISQIWQ